MKVLTRNMAQLLALADQLGEVQGIDITIRKRDKSMCVLRVQNLAYLGQIGWLVELSGQGKKAVTESDLDMDLAIAKAYVQLRRLLEQEGQTAVEESGNPLEDAFFYQMARVLTEEELKQYVCFDKPLDTIEERLNMQEKAPLYTEFRESDPYMPKWRDAWNIRAMLQGSGYGSAWRCWKWKPSDQKRAETPWKELRQ